jgi:hypothetical protein
VKASAASKSRQGWQRLCVSHTVRNLLTAKNGGHIVTATKGKKKKKPRVGLLEHETDDAPLKPPCCRQRHNLFRRGALAT